MRIKERTVRRLGIHMVSGLRWTPFNCSVFTFTDQANSMEAEVGVEMSHSTEHIQVCTVRS